MSVRAQVLLWTMQRLTAAVLAVCVVAHLVTMIYAVRHGLSAADILGRTRGNYAWFAFYVTFVAAVAIHTVLFEKGADEFLVSVGSGRLAVSRRGLRHADRDRDAHEETPDGAS